MAFDIVIGGDAQPDVGFDIVIGTSAGAIPAIGPAGAATFVLDLVDDLEVTYSWAVDVRKSLNGLEQRIQAGGDAPAQRYRASAYLVDGDERTVRTALLTAAATGQAFLLALPYEGLELAADATGTILHVGSTALSDWASNPGQRVAVLAPDGELVTGVVQNSTADTIQLEADPGTAGREGGRVMPLMAVYLEPQQGLRRHPVEVSKWQIAARASLFGFAGVDQMGVGAAVTTYDGFPVYDQKIDVDGAAEGTILTLGEIIEAGGLPLAVGGASVIDQGRPIAISSDDVAGWQWFKRFIYTVGGSRLAFLRPTWQPDLVFDSNPGAAQLLIKSGSVAGAGNYLAYFNASLAHRRLQILKSDGSVQYVTISAAGDNGDGTITLNLSATVTGEVAMISFLETCRLERSDVTVRWGKGWRFASQLVARVVQQLDPSGATATYLEDDSGIETSRPVELYEFTNALGTVTRRTSFPRDFVFDGNTYFATAGLKRGHFAIVSGNDVPEMTVELPMGDALVEAYAGVGVPPQKWLVRILRVQRTSGESEQVWRGYVRDCDLSSKRVAVLSVAATTTDSLDTPIPNIILSKLCNHVLYNKRCKVDRNAFKVEPLILAIDPDGRTLTVSSVGTFGTTDARFGDSRHPTSGEWRSIVEQNGTTIVLDVPLPSAGPLAAAVGQTIELYRGCDRTIPTCRDVFDNVVNFVGAPHLVTKTRSWPEAMDLLAENT
jgi:uncharacterized phage protein (TIGR02218 family)